MQALDEVRRIVHDELLPDAPMCRALLELAEAVDFQDGALKLVVEVSNRQAGVIEQLLRGMSAQAEQIEALQDTVADHELHARAL